MKSVCVVQARMGSTRLRGKVLLPLNGHTVLAEVLTRCQKIKVDDLVCAVPYADVDVQDEAAKYCRVVRGPEDDVLGRYVMASEGFDVVMRVTSDCPLLSPDLCNEVLNALPGHDYASNIEPRTFPQGFDCEVFTRDALLKAHRESDEREHVTTYLRNGPFKRANVASPWKLDGRVTLDTEDDYRVICAAFGHEPYQNIRAYWAAA
jgi:spore coat polysaccharide biosynthesis protein SpsF